MRFRRRRCQSRIVSRMSRASIVATASRCHRRRSTRRIVRLRGALGDRVPHAVPERASSGRPQPVKTRRIHGSQWSQPAPRCWCRTPNPHSSAPTASGRHTGRSATAVGASKNSAAITRRQPPGSPPCSAWYAGNAWVIFGWRTGSACDGFRDATGLSCSTVRASRRSRRIRPFEDRGAVRGPHRSTAGSSGAVEGERARPDAPASSARAATRLALLRLGFHILSPCRIVFCASQRAALAAEGTHRDRSSHRDASTESAKLRRAAGRGGARWLGALVSSPLAVRAHGWTRSRPRRP